MIKNGPRTSVKISLGWRKISVSSLPRKEEIRIKNLTIRSLHLKYFNKHIVIGKCFLLDRFNVQFLRLTPCHESGNGCVGFINDEIIFLFVDYLYFAVHKRQSLQLMSLVVTHAFCSFDANDISTIGAPAQIFGACNHQ